MDTRPYPLTPEEWREVITIERIREAWGLWKDATPEEFTASVYGVKFNFHSGSPGYVGDLYILQGDALTGRPPVMLKRDDSGKMVVI
jgi:hypothetical protein